MAAAVGPASHIYGNADRGWMAGGVFNVYTHNGIFSANSLRSKADGIDAVFQQTLHFCCICIFIVGTDRAHQRFL